MSDKNRYMSGSKVEPPAIRKGMAVDGIIDSTFLAFNAGKLQKACRLFADRIDLEQVNPVVEACQRRHESQSSYGRTAPTVPVWPIGSGFLWTKS